MEDGGGRARVDVRSRLMMDFGVDGATCKSPASICVMGPSFFGRQAAAEPESLLVDVRQAPPEDGSTTALDGASHLAGGGELPPCTCPAARCLKAILVKGRRYSTPAFRAQRTFHSRSPAQVSDPDLQAVCFTLQKRYGSGPFSGPARESKTSQCRLATYRRRLPRYPGTC